MQGWEALFDRGETETHRSSGLVQADRCQSEERGCEQGLQAAARGLAHFGSVGHPVLPALAGMSSGFWLLRRGWAGPRPRTVEGRGSDAGGLGTGRGQVTGAGPGSMETPWHGTLTSAPSSPSWTQMTEAWAPLGLPGTPWVSARCSEGS